MDAHRDTQDDESRSKFDSGWLVVEVVWRVATKQRKANRFLDVADGVGWFYASNRTLDDVAGIYAPQVCVAGSMLSNVTGES